jgi:hypothetical protein
MAGEQTPEGTLTRAKRTLGRHWRWLKPLSLRYVEAFTLDITKLKTKKQSTRMVKCECPDCGYIVRTTRKWLEEGAPICPCNKREMRYEGRGSELEEAA